MISHYIFSYGRTVFVMATLTNYIGFLCTYIQLYVCVVQYHQMSVHAFSLLFFNEHILRYGSLVVQ